jgi:hypothetical protein
MALSAADRKAIAAMIAEGIGSVLAPQLADTEDDTAEVIAVTTPRKRKSQSTKSAPKASSARRKRGEKVAEWTVRESWKGSEASPRTRQGSRRQS